MKHLKRFNEGGVYDDREKELFDFCSMYLIDLIDKGCTLKISYIGSDNYRFNLWNVNADRLSPTTIATASDIKDSLLPLIHMLKQEYDMDDIVFKIFKSLDKGYTVDDILSNCELEDDVIIVRVLFNIKFKK